MARLDLRKAGMRWNEMYYADRGNWLQAHSYSYLFERESFHNLPKNIQKHFALGDADAGELQQVRNQLGPSWLTRFNLRKA